jgi:RNA polymerase sigma-70 factor (ECF subfamily)
MPATPRPNSDADGAFATTHWSMVLKAGHNQTADDRAALAELCETYWYPVYAFLRRKGRPAEDAADLTQAFFARLLDKEVLSAVEPGRGRFRSFLLKSVQNFAANEDAAARAQRRGGGRSPIRLDVPDAEGRYLHEPGHDVTPERLFDRRWALSLLERTLSRLRQATVRHGDHATFDRLKTFLSGPLPDDSYASVAAELGTTEAAVKVAIHRMRKRYRELLREEIGRTVESEAEIEDEIGQLFAALGS